MKLHDISWPISESMTTYKDKKQISIVANKLFGQDKVRETMITLSSHTGTHVDAPSHFIEHGKGAEIYTLDQLCGPCVVVDLTRCNMVITKADVAALDIPYSTIILLKTKNSFLQTTHPFNPHFIYVDKEAAQYLVQYYKIKAIGIDYLGIERNQLGHETHRMFLEQNIPIIEGIRLADVQAGRYTLFCLPLLIPGCDGAPARAVIF
jgi:arylformamidase